ncbi:MAG TPA: CDGSH iron-sulfur domain-containing protein [Gammaproteobacteria bacterium]|nr:CDGSH iron-sulfur domain-containing protein [Gammaproteobacteria bacterium]
MADSNANSLTLKVDGPMVCRGDITLVNAAGEVLLKDREAWLCRCGESKKMPFCDGSHRQADFHDAGEFEDERAEKLEQTTGPLLITVKPNAMLIIRGPLTIQSVDGRFRSQRSRGALCRCGQSARKPFCDASHKRCGFKEA